MARAIYIVNATQVVTSESHPEGLFSTVSGFPKTFDSYSSNEESALKQAKSAYFDQLSKNYANTTESRVMMTVTLERSDGRMIMWESIGGFPVVEQAEE